MSSHRPRVFRLRTPDGSGRSLSLDPNALTMSSDPLKDAAVLTGTLGLIAELRGNIEREALEMVAEYRNWSAMRAVRVLEDSPKMAEHKVKAKVESEPEFLEYKRAIARLEGDALFLRAFFDAALTKARMIQLLVGEEAQQRRAESIPQENADRIDEVPTRMMALSTRDERVRERVRDVITSKSTTSIEDE